MADGGGQVFAFSLITKPARVNVDSVSVIDLYYENN